MTIRIKLKEEEDRWSPHRQFYTVHLKSNGRRIGHCSIESFQGKRASSHVHLDEKWRKKGYGRELYDLISKRLDDMGILHVPSPNLTHLSYRMWKVRAPELLVNHYDVCEDGKNWSLNPEGHRLYRSASLAENMET